MASRFNHQKLLTEVTKSSVIGSLNAICIILDRIKMLADVPKSKVNGSRRFVQQDETATRRRTARSTRRSDTIFYSRVLVNTHMLMQCGVLEILTTKENERGKKKKREIGNLRHS